MLIQVKKLSENAIVPTRGSAGAAGYDLYSTEDYVLKPSERKLFKTNISMKIPDGYYGRLAPRSGLAFKNGIDVLAGVIDEDYLGDIGVILLNTNNKRLLNEEKLNISGYTLSDVNDGVLSQEEIYERFDKNSLIIKKGDRIAQIIFEKYHVAEFQEVDEIVKTDRDSGGFGSTGS